MRWAVWWGMGWIWAVASAMAQPAATVLLGAEDDWAPYSTVSVDRRGVTGLSPDLVSAAFATQGVQVRFQSLPFARCMLHAQRGVIAGCFNATRTQDIHDQYCWHPTPLFTEELAIFGPMTAPETLTRAQMAGKRLGVTLGYTYPSEWMQDPRIIRVSAASDDNLLKMLVAGRVDYILLNTMPGWERIARMPAVQGRIKRVAVVRQDGFWVAFSKQHPEGQRLCAQFEQGLQVLRASGRYEQMMAQFRARWLPR